MPLSIDYDLQTIEGLVRALADEVAPDKIQSTTMIAIINKNTNDISEQLNGASAPDYNTTLVVSDAASSYLASIVTSAGYTFATRTIAKTSHGYTSSDIGKRIVFWDATSDPTAKMAIAQIESITDDNNFVVTIANSAANITSPNCDFGLFSSHSTANIDLSAVRVNKVIKLVDSNKGLVGPKKDLEFENLSNNTQYVNSVLYNYAGKTLYLFKGASVSAWGTLTLHYYRNPTPVSADADMIDLSDNYIHLLIDKCYLDVYAIGKMQPPQSITDNIKSATANIRQTNLEKEAIIAGKKG